MSRLLGHDRTNPLKQRGGTLGTLVVLIALAVVGYYVYQQYFGSVADAPPSCKAQLNTCLVICRRTTSEAPDYQACEQRCNQQASACQDK
jgi:hypothetical protein